MFVSLYFLVLRSSWRFFKQSSATKQKKAIFSVRLFFYLMFFGGKFSPKLCKPHEYKMSLFFCFLFYSNLLFLIFMRQLENILNLPLDVSRIWWIFSVRFFWLSCCYTFLLLFPLEITPKFRTFLLLSTHTQYRSESFFLWSLIFFWYFHAGLIQFWVDLEPHRWILSRKIWICALPMQLFSTLTFSRVHVSEF